MPRYRLFSRAGQRDTGDIGSGPGPRHLIVVDLKSKLSIRRPCPWQTCKFTASNGHPRALIIILINYPGAARWPGRAERDKSVLRVKHRGRAEDRWKRENCRLESPEGAITPRKFMPRLYSRDGTAFRRLADRNFQSMARKTDAAVLNWKLPRNRVISIARYFPPYRDVIFVLKRITRV